MPRNITEVEADFERVDNEITDIRNRYGTDPATMPAGQAQRLDNLTRRANNLASELDEVQEAQRADEDRAQRRAAVVDQVRAQLANGAGVDHIGNGPAVHSRAHATPYAGLTPGAGLADDSAAGLRSRAMDLAEAVADVPTAARKFYAEAVEADRDPQARLARWALATGRDAYRTAFAKLLADPTRGHLLWSEAERSAFHDVELVSRAMGTGSGAAGSFMVPFFLDPAIMLTNAGVNAGLLSAVRKVTTAGNAWHGVSSDGVTFEWLAEGTEAGDGSPTLAQPDVKLHKASVFVPFSVEFETSSAETSLAELQSIMVDAYQVNVAEAIANGNGNGQPTGILTALADSITALGTADTLAAADVYGLQSELGARFQPGAKFAANLATINELAQLETSNGAKQFPEITDDKLSRRPLVEDSTLGTVGDASGASVAYGDFERGYVFATGVGSRVELVQHVMGANGRPTGQRGLWLWATVGGNVVVPDAIKLLGV